MGSCVHEIHRRVLPVLAPCFLAFCFLALSFLPREAQAAQGAQVVEAAQAAQGAQGVHSEVASGAPPVAPEPSRAEASVSDTVPPLRFSGVLQPRLTAETAPGEGGRPVGVRLRRARVALDAFVLDPRISIRVVPEFAGAEARLMDAWVDVAPRPGIRIRAGQGPVPFHWQRASSSSRHHLPERSASSEELGTPGGRDVGLSLRVDGAEARRTLEIGVFDGGGMGRRAQVTHGWLASSRASWAVTGARPASEPELAGVSSPGVALGVGAQMARHHQSEGWGPGGTTGGATGGSVAHFQAGTLDLVAHLRGLSLVAEGFTRRVEPLDGVRDPWTARGGSLSFGAFLLPSRLEVVTRLGRSDLRPDPDPRVRRLREAGVNLYLDGHRTKVQTAVREDRRTGRPVHRILISQLQVLF